MFLPLNFQHFPLAETLSGEHILSEYDPEIISFVLDHLVSEKIRIAVIGKAVAERAVCNEKWYGTQYCMQNLEEATIKSLEECGLNEELKLPPKNEFVPTDFKLFTSEEVICFLSLHLF